MAISLFWSNYCSNPLNFTNKSIVNKLSLSQMGRRKDYDRLSLSYKWVVLCLLSQLCLTYSIPGPQTSFIFNRKPPVSCSPPNFSRAESSGCFAVPNASQQGSLCGHPHHIQIEKWAKKVCINNLVQSAEMLLYFCMTSSLPFGIGSCWCTVKKKKGGERETLHSYINFILFNKKQYQIKNTNTSGDYPAFFPVCLVELKPTKDWKKKSKKPKK